MNFDPTNQNEYNYNNQYNIILLYEILTRWNIDFVSKFCSANFIVLFVRNVSTDHVVQQNSKGPNCSFTSIVFTRTDPFWRRVHTSSYVRWLEWITEYVILYIDYICALYIYANVNAYIYIYTRCSSDVLEWPQWSVAIAYVAVTESWLNANIILATSQK